MISEKDFLKITKLIIQNIEGGYFSWDYHKNVKNVERMGKSGETMFGIDRANGGSIPENQQEYNEFWAIIDKNKNPKEWVYNYRGGKLEKQLTELAAKIQYKEFLHCVKYKIEEKGYETVKKIVNRDKKVALHFVYASWNGIGYFGQFADQLNNYLNEKHTSKEIWQFCLDCRRKIGGLIAIGADKLEGIVNNNKLFFSSFNLKKTLVIGGLALLLVGAGYYLVKKNKKR